MLIKYSDALKAMKKLDAAVHKIPDLAQEAVSQYLERAAKEGEATMAAAGEVLILAFREHDDVLAAATILRHAIAEAEARAGEPDGKAERKRLRQSAKLWSTIANHKAIDGVSKMPKELRSRAALEVERAQEAIKSTPDNRGQYNSLGVQVTDEMYEFLFTRDLVFDQRSPYLMKPPV